MATEEYGAAGSGEIDSSSAVPSEKEPLMHSDGESKPPIANEHSQTTLCGITCDPDLVKYKAFFFLFFGGFGATFPYLGLYFKQIGLNAKYVGILAGVRPLIQFVSGPFWAVLADRYKCRKGILLFSILAWLVMTLLLVLPRPQKEVCKVTNITHPALDAKNVRGDKKSAIPDYSLAFQSRIGEFLYTSSCVVDCDKKEAHGTSSSSVARRNVANSSKHIVAGSWDVTYEIQRDAGELWDIFIILLILIVAGEFLEAPSFIMTDTALLEHLGENRKYYGKTRLFGSLGYGLASFCVGGILDLWKFDYCGKIYTNYIGIFYFFCGFMVIAFFFGWFFINFKYVDAEKKASLSEVLRMFANLKYGTFLAVSWAMGFFHGGIMNFLNWYLEDLGATKFMMGIATAFRCVCIVSAFFTSGYFIERFGHLPIIYFAFAAYVASFFGYSVIPNPWWAIPIECAQGVTYSMSWSACITYLGEVSPPNAQATVQGILQGVYWGLGTGLGAIVGGVMINRFGVIKSFQAGGVLSFFSFFLFLAIQLVIARRERKETNERRTKLIEEDD